jgi:hypothetical protein
MAPAEDITAVAVSSLAAADADPAVSAAVASAPHVAAVNSGPQTFIEEVASIVASIVGGQIGSDEPLMAAGLDSLGGIDGS